MKHKKERILEEQQAPLKNTDHAFVQVGKDGAPRLPGHSKVQEVKETKTERPTRVNKP